MGFFMGAVGYVDRFLAAIPGARRIGYVTLEENSLNKLRDNLKKLGKEMATGDQDKYCYRGAYGKFILIEHKNNLTTLYAHLSRQIVKENDIVKRGDLIGYVGKTGYAIGPHLHFTVYGTPVLMKQSRVCGLMPFGGYLNPLDYL